MSKVKPLLAGWRDFQAQAEARVVWRRPQLPDVILAVGSVSLVVVCLGLLAVPAYHKLQLRNKATAVLGNAATLQLAAETYAACHQGRYAADALDLLPYLPAGEAPTNPYTAAVSRFRRVAGDLTYRSPTRGGDYVIEAFDLGHGGEPRLITTLTGKTPR